MSEEKKNKIFTVADIEKYHKGLLSPKEMHELERAALEDPLLADALEGYGSVSTNVAADLAGLEKKLEERIAGGSKLVTMAPTRKSFKWWKVAAAVIIFAAVGFLTFKLSWHKRENAVADLKQKSEGPAAIVTADSNRPGTTVISDSVISDKPTEAARVKPSTKRSLRETRYKTVDTTAVASAATEVSPTQANKQERSDSTKNQPVSEGFAAPAAARAKKSEPGATRLDGLSDRQKSVNAPSPMNYFNGRVIDASNNPLPFANITNVRDEVGTYADARGYFTLISPDSVLNVRVRSVGFETGVARLDDERSNQVVLREDKIAPDKILSAQQSDTNRSFARTMKLEEPEPVDGWTNYHTYMANNVNVPEDLKIPRDNGQVQLSFDVNQNGEPINIRVEKSLCKKCDEEAVRLIKDGPKWKQKNKKAKRVTVSIPFHK